MWHQEDLQSKDWRSSAGGVHCTALWLSNGAVCHVSMASKGRNLLQQVLHVGADFYMFNEVPAGFYPIAFGFPPQ